MALNLSGGSWNCRSMKSLAALVVFSLTLSACAPLAIFASSSNNYRSSFGTQVANSRVNAFCISPPLRLAIWEFEGRFRKKIVMTSGYRTPWHNASVGGASSSKHMSCDAADFFIPGVPRSELVAFAKTLSQVGGLGCYRGRNYIHIDTRQRPRGYRGPVTWGC
ncbi:MAG TPA: DUF882 domain-containing protein [Devosia sp.]|nr:DUF882 domain-containing protein [Devosia sp.]